MNSVIRVLIADRNPTFRVGLWDMLEQMTDVSIVGEVGEGKGALKQILALQPDVVVLDCQMPGMMGAAVAKAMQQRHLATRVLAIGASAMEHEVLPMLQAGALGYALRYDAPEAIARGIGAVARGEAWFSSTVAAQLAAWMARARPRQSGLTQREVAVLRLIAQGETNKEIASALIVAESTVEFHVGNILRKLGVTSRREATRWAEEQALDR